MTGEVVDLQHVRDVRKHGAAVVEISRQINEALEKPMDTPRWSDPPAPGIYRGVPFAQYASWDAANHSTLMLFERSAAHAREALIRPDAPTAALDFGHALHLAVLEPDLLEGQFIRGIKVDRRFKDQKREWEEFVVRAGGRTPLLPEEWDHCLAMRDAVWSGPSAEILKGGLKEVCLVWDDPDTKLRCKSRVDHFGAVYGWSVIVDVKSAADASEGAFSRAVARYGYHHQAAFYIDGANALAPRQRRFLHLVIEKEPPFCSAVYELDATAIEQGRRDYRRHLRAYAKAKASGEWPGYAPGITPLSIPRWAVSQPEESETEA